MATPADARTLLAAYDAQLRTDAEVAGSLRWHRHGPLWRAVFADGGFVSYQHLADEHGSPLEGDQIDELIADTVRWYGAQGEVDTVEWKTRGHDAPADLGDRLAAAGFVAQDQETVMVGDAVALDVDVVLPAGVELLRVDQLPDRDAWLERRDRLNALVFGRAGGVEDLVRRLEARPGLIEVWVAHHDGEVLSSGRLEEVAGSDFAGIWGGGTHPDWRGRGIYRAMTAARARSAVGRGLRFLHSDSTPMSRPILERSGLVPVTTTTPYLWRRADPSGPSRARQGARRLSRPASSPPT